MTKGQIIKALSGFYYIQVGQEIFQTRGRGLFRKQKLKPLVGDWVTFESENLSEGVISSIFPRKNELIRPPLSNVDVALIVMSAVEPDFSTHLVDRFLIYLESKHIQPAIILTKMDLATDSVKERLMNIKKEYEEIGYRVWLSQTLNTYDFFSTYANQLIVFMGQSGVGKSTLINQFLPDLDLDTAAISTSLGRGRHTTRHVELHPVNKVLIADTPGFSMIDLLEVEKENLGACFPEFKQYSSLCKFRECSHLHEPDCQVRAALERGEILPERYQHYQQFYEEIKNRKPNYLKKGKL